jgi:hypothetical protein
MNQVSHPLPCRLPKVVKTANFILTRSLWQQYTSYLINPRSEERFSDQSAPPSCPLELSPPNGEHPVYTIIMSQSLVCSPADQYMSFFPRFFLDLCTSFLHNVKVLNYFCLGPHNGCYYKTLPVSYEARRLCGDSLFSSTGDAGNCS